MNVSSHPASQFLHRYIAVAAFFYGVIFGTLINFPLQVSMPKHVACSCYRSCVL